MMWREVLENPKAVEMFDREPTLDNVTLSRVLFDRDGPSVTMAIQLHDYPANPPAKWRGRGHNAVTMEIQAVGIEHSRMQGWSTDNLVSISVERLSDGKLRIHASGETTEIEIMCGWIRVVGLTPYCFAA